jgi:hypothetical protein
MVYRSNTQSLMEGLQYRSHHLDLLTLGGYRETLVIIRSTIVETPLLLNQPCRLQIAPAF